MKQILFLLSFVLLAQLSFSQSLSKEQKLEDFNYLFTLLKESYPYTDVLERQVGYRWTDYEKKYRDAIQASTSDQEFAELIHQILGNMQNNHTDLYPTRARKYYLDIYCEMEGRENWCEQLEKAGTRWDELFDKGKQDDSGLPPYDDSNVSFIKMSKDVAVIRIQSFTHHQVEKDAMKLQEYLKRLKGVSHLIIDIQDNSGGDSRFWSEHLVPYLVNEEMVYKETLAIRKSDYLKNYFEGLFSEDVLEELDADQYPSLPPELKRGEYYFIIDNDTLTNEKSIGFKGEIYLMVNRSVFSSSEALAVFSKSTGWATVVGEQTAGDGVGIDPVIVCLPHSKLLLRFPGEMGLNPDGSSNEEAKTQPDIPVEARSSEERLYRFAKRLDPDMTYTYVATLPILNKAKSQILIYPTNERSAKLNEQILMQCKSMNKRFFHLPDSMIMADTLALSKDLSAYDLVCYGSVTGNLWVQKHIGDLPIEVAPDYIQAKEKHEGKDLRLICTWYNPSNKDKTVTYYTAQTGQGVVHINGVFHGDTCYVIAGANFQAIEKGNYQHVEGKIQLR